MFIFGPDRLPKAISDGVKMLRNLRDMARNATGDLSRELGTDISLEDLNPKALLRKHLLSEEDERALRKPFEDLYRDVQSDVRGVHGELRDATSGLDPRSVIRGNGSGGGARRASGSKPVSGGGPADRSGGMAPRAVEPYVFDDDAT